MFTCPPQGERGSSVGSEATIDMEVMRLLLSFTTLTLPYLRYGLWIMDYGQLTLDFDSIDGLIIAFELNTILHAPIA